MRGWTLVRRGVDHGPIVSPAHAGMDPFDDFHRNPFSGFPRTCGDGPYHAEHGKPDTKFPPHMRGWTAHGKRTDL